MSCALYSSYWVSIINVLCISSELPSLEDAVDVWHYALEALFATVRYINWHLHLCSLRVARNDDDDDIT